MFDNMDKKKKKIAMIVGVVILVIILLAVIIAVTRKPKKESRKTKASKKAMESLCHVTDYEQTCNSELIANGAQEILDPKELIKLEILVATRKLGGVINEVQLRLEKEYNDRGISESFNICKEVLNGSIIDLQKSYNKLNGTIDDTDLGGLVSDLKTWLTGAITFEQTCLDTFEKTRGDAGEKMDKLMKTSCELTSNGLAMVTEFSLILATLEKSHMLGGKRKLLSEEGSQEFSFPGWVGPTRRSLLQATPANIKPNVVIAQDGSGKYKTIKEALKDIPLYSNNTFVIYVRAGIYKENLIFTQSMSNVMLIGDGPTKTKISGSNSYGGDAIKAYTTATLGANGEGFILKDIAVENTAGAEVHQAVALRMTADKAIIYNCQIDGYQNTLYVHAHRQFYRDCTISGTIDFVMGNAAAVFQNCKMVVRKPKDNQKSTMMAQSRSETRQNSGFVLQNCTITADPDIAKGETVSAFLGRPLKNLSRVVIMNSHIDSVIAPEGWQSDSTAYQNTVCYAELNNTGPGADTSKRVTWPGIKKLTPAEADEFIPTAFIWGDAWIPATGVPYVGGMMKT